MIVNQDALGALYTFVLLICPPAHPHCSEKTPGAIVRREENLGQFACDMKLEAIKDRITPKFRGRTRARCEWHQDNRA